MILAFVCGWFFSQVVKLIVGFFEKRGKLKFSDVVYYMTKSGGMPSGHTASFMALTTVIYFLEGFNSPIFVLALCTMGIIVYDAVNVRYAVGEQGKVMNRIIIDTKIHEKKVKLVEGHTIPQVIAGGVLGLVIGVAIAAIGGIGL